MLQESHECDIILWLLECDAAIQVQNFEPGSGNPTSSLGLVYVWHCAKCLDDKKLPRTPQFSHIDVLIG